MIRRWTANDDLACSLPTADAFCTLESIGKQTRNAPAIGYVKNFNHLNTNGAERIALCDLLSHRGAAAVHHLTLRNRMENFMETDVETRLARGMELIPQLADLTADDVNDDLRARYVDIQHTLRVPFVNFIFRTLANFPDYLLHAWTGLAPHLCTLNFEHAADRLRAAAAPDVAVEALEFAPAEDSDRQAIADFTDAIHYVLPKLLLIATAFDQQLNGRFSVEAMPAGSPHSRLPYGVAEGAVKLELVDPAQAAPRVRQLFKEIQSVHRHPGVASYYRGIAAEPVFLERVWERVRRHVGSDDYQLRKQNLLTRAEETATHRLLRKDASPASSEQESVAAILAVFRYRLIPDLLLDVALIKAMLDGPEAALRSRFSVS